MDADRPTRVSAAAVAAVLAVAGGTLTSGCQADRSSASPSTRAAETRSPRTPRSTVAPVPVIHVGDLPRGAPPRAAYLAGGMLRFGGRTVPAALGTQVFEPEILGSVDGRVVLTAAAQAPTPGITFFTVDAAGQVRQLTSAYPSSEHRPALVEQTGHLWVTYADRGGGGQRTWLLDARTGRQLAVFHTGGPAPRGLAPADQALYDAWSSGRQDLPATHARSPDGSLDADVVSVPLPHGRSASRVTVRPASGGPVVAGFTFPDDVTPGVSAVVFEDDDHVLLLVGHVVHPPHGPATLVVRCTIDSGACERATADSAPIALGVAAPRFLPAPR